MFIPRVLTRSLPAFLAGIGAAVMFTPRLSVLAGTLDPKVLTYKLPDQIQWKETASGSQEAVLLGDPSKAGLYIILVKWLPHRMSHPHYHPNDRYAMVIKGPWYVGTGPKFDPDGTTPVPAGTFATHHAKQIHYDGAKDQEVILEIVGQGPETAVNAEQK